MSTETAVPSQDSTRIGGPALIAFLAMILFGGSNAIAVRFSNEALPPFWGATIRFVLTGVLFWAWVAVARIPIPRGRALVGSIVVGVLNTGLNYALLYWALLVVPASLTMVILALGPLLTFFLAWAHGQESFRWRGLIGAIIAFVGIVIAAGAEVGTSIPLLPILAVAVAAVMVSEGAILFKYIPPTNPVAVNAVAVTVGAAILMVISLIAGETWSLALDQRTWLVTGYLVVGGTFILFYLYLFVLERWTASATSYSFLLFPIATAILASWLADETITVRFILGGVVVLVGVWLGALTGSSDDG